MAAVARAEWIETPDALAALEPGWRALEAEAGVFLGWDWISAWLAAFDAEARPCLLVVRRGERLLAALPLARRRVRLFGLLPVAALTMIGAGVAAADHLDVLMSPGEQGVAGPLLRDALRRRRTLLWLEGLAAEGLLPRLLAEGFAIAELSRAPIRRLLLPENYEAYLQTLPAKRRRRNGWRRRKLEGEFPGQVRFETVTDALPEAMRSLFALHQAVQTGRGAAGSFASAAMRALHQGVAARLLAQGRLRLHRIMVGDAAIAAMLCFRHGAVTSFYSTGYDEAWERHNPGRQVMAFAIEQAIADGSRVFDFLRGDEPYKAALANDAVDNVTLLAGATPLAALLVRLQAAYKGVRRRLRPGRRTAPPAPPDDAA